MSNSTLAARISTLIDKWNGYKNQLRDLLTKADGTVDMEDGIGNIVTLPTFPSLQANVKALTDSLTGSVAQAQSINAQTVLYMNAAGNSATASDTARAASVDAKDASALSASASASSAFAAKASETNSKTSETNSKTSETNAASSKEAAAGSAATAGTQAINAANSATAALASQNDAATSKTLAMNYANAAVNVPVEPDRYSAFHWAEQARLNVLGSLVFKGKFSAAGGAMPANPKLGDFYIVSAAGTINSVKYSTGDMLFFDGTDWDRIDNQTIVQSVAGRTGNVVIGISDLAGLQSALDSKQASLGFKAVQQGTGIGQLDSLVKIGWSGSRLKATVDVTDLGNFAMETWSNATFAPISHTHAISEVRGLQPVLDAKVGPAGPFSVGDSIGRSPNNLLPTTNGKSVRFDFINGIGGSRYSGLMTFSPFDGGTASTGDASYQMSFGGTASDGAGVPELQIRKGVDSTWGGWHRLWHSGNFTPGSKQDALGYTPVQQGNGVGQTSNAVKIGWSSAGKVKVTVDATDMGNIALESWATSTFIARNVSNVTTGTYFQSPVFSIAAINGANQDRQTALIIGNASNTSASATMSFLREGSYGVHFGLDTDNVMKIGGWSMGAVAYRVVHEGLQNWVCPTTLSIGGVLLQSNSGLQVNGNLRVMGGDLIQLNNTSNGWMRVPRSFVQSNDPGYQAGPGDLWIW